MIVLTPLTLKGTRSMLAMQRLQPDMKRLQAKYKDDRQKLNEEMLKFYKEHGINPVSGCLPLLLQMPVFFFLYQTLLGLTKRGPYGADMGAAVAKEAANTGTYEQFGVFHPQHLDKSSDLYQSLHSTREMSSWGLDLAESASSAVGKGIGHAAPFILLVLLVAATSYIQQKQVAGRTPQAQVNPQQQLLLKLMPAFFALISLTLPAGIVLYFLVSNLYRIGQQAFITRTMYHDGGPLATTATETEPSPTKTKEAVAASTPARKGILGMLTASRESQDGDEATPKPAPTKSGSAKTSGKAGAVAKPSRGTTANGRTSQNTRGAKPASNGSKSVTKSARSGTAPSRQRPPAPVNRSKAKKKRK